MSVLSLTGSILFE